MSCRDRECKTCGYIEIDLIEKTDANISIECPECHNITFQICPACPSVIVISGEGTSALEFCNELDRRRANAAEGHGNTSLSDSKVGVKYGK